MSSSPQEPSRNRGRPRKASTATPDTVRRTQLREAQRAYRSRQQSLLATLKSRVAILEDAFGQLGQIMDSFDSRVVKPGAQLSQAQLLQAVKLLQNEISFQLRRAGCHASPNEDSCSPTSHNQNHQQTRNRPSSKPCQGDKATTGGPAWTKEKAQSSDFWRRFLGSSNGFLPPVKPIDHESSPCISLPLSIDRDNHTIVYATTTFTQRLYRTSAENGYRYLNNATVVDEDMLPQFGLVSQSVSREQLRVYFGRVLRTRPCNPVYDRRFPFISLGGAGTHFPQATQGSRSQNLLPFRTTNGVLELPSDEEWFDVNDIEGFLIEKGIVLKENYLASVLSISRMDGDSSMTHNLPLQSGNIVDSSGLFIPDQSTPSNMVMVLDEDPVIDGLSRLCICLGCVAGFRRSDVETLVWQNVTWKPV
ncbi:bZIP transcription factor [Aspergillus alliaceus]|uniref:bZIP transcription factor n=1 Tax=Petromyces alliaceus TaxID=209559 RepID=UPI0012A5C7B4|nr:uncharacterized protein BDW43DRAFT_94944 [Aspergillus alliaceus]KAB8233131.1 hypothetical protein BDW43DRAFT_94944 [Aspergillus alliaceus]